MKLNPVHYNASHSFILFLRMFNDFQDRVDKRCSQTDTTMEDVKNDLMNVVTDLKTMMEKTFQTLSTPGNVQGKKPLDLLVSW